MHLEITLGFIKELFGLIESELGFQSKSLLFKIVHVFEIV